MKFIKDTCQNQHSIQKYQQEPYFIQIKNIQYTSPLLITQDNLKPISTHYNDSEFLKIIDQLIHQNTFEILLIGTGSKYLPPHSELLLLCNRHKIGLETMSTHAACRTHNILLQDKRTLATILIP
ncbi:MAG TPA: Mth938-like domain-containing protein [Gammaproteobacteria bacterium]|nr:Mth938-like domain-containing protein [Gammaproteobacteria bacterium]